MKRITLCALLMTLFLLISCNTSGSATKDGQAAKSDGTLIDLKSASSKIKSANDLAVSIKEIEGLVKSIDELAKGIGKKVKNTGELEDNATHKDKNSAVVAGAYSIMLHISTKLTALKSKFDYDELKAKIGAAENLSTAFLEKVKKDNDLCKDDATAEHTQQTILKNHGTKTKGAQEIDDLNTAITDLSKAAKEIVESAINELTSPVKSSN
ncbi:Vsp/OspC family lipoprotein [Borrelia puertoricensis]|uniref:Vsp/OspC family lipoprotein n=1 Tax=Borrelia puertoricensis TaxID=2756107 RepID=UPI001FF625FC|nr:Vsp/OspC family lipoprotein [Borrelia puertoricensis]